MDSVRDGFGVLRKGTVVRGWAVSARTVRFGSAWLGLFGQGSHGKEQLRGAKERRQNERIYKQVFMERWVQFQSIR